jgi:nucleoid DNA-binding protein
MRSKHGLALTLLLAALGLVLAPAEPVHSQRPLQPQAPLPQRPLQPARPPQKELSLFEKVAKAAGLKEEQVRKVYAELGGAIRQELASGKTVSFPGLGTFRVVQIAAHRDLINGRPATVSPANVVEFVPEAGMDAAANSPSARPVETIPPFEYIPLPGQTPGQKVPSSRNQGIRTR